ncbi:redox-sensitive transcriptional activator SoxR [Stappia indica]|uniref:redox-sensitive transcriptional activator SoxR n=1 Tax=Stappia indica TaxID=538381 RepID=UPI00083771E4|nr:redox-sensitive transcriptional activator SoxR [Stappia indica]
MPSPSRGTRPDPVLTIQQVARRSGVAASALRYYEERGLIAAERAASGHRRFERSVLRRIAFIVFAQRLGFTLEEVKRELDKLPSDHIPTGADWEQLSQVWTQRVDERIDELQRLKRGLAACISCGCLSLAQCSLANPGDRAGALGPGPRYWVGTRGGEPPLP